MKPLIISKKTSHCKIFALPVLPNNVECAAHVHLYLSQLNPAAIALALPAGLQKAYEKASERLPEVTLISTHGKYILVEPADAYAEAMRSQRPFFCIGEAENEPSPDPYAIAKIGHERYFERQCHQTPFVKGARFLRDLSFRYDSILYIGPPSACQAILATEKFDETTVPQDPYELFALDDESLRSCMSEYGFLTLCFEELKKTTVPDRLKIQLKLFQKAKEDYEADGGVFPKTALRTLCKFARNLSLLTGQLAPRLYEILTAAQGCVDANYAYFVFRTATDYPNKNIDNLPQRTVSPEEIWGGQKRILFHRRLPNRAALEQFFRRTKNHSKKHEFNADRDKSLCSWPKEDLVIEGFGTYLKEKARRSLCEENARSFPFETSIEDGIDMKETIRHLSTKTLTKTLYVRQNGKIKAKASSVVLIFDEDTDDSRFPWKLTWLGEHEQESDMALYATPYGKDLVGPGISRCFYGGLLLSSPPRRMMDVWTDAVFSGLSKSETLLAAAIDYAVDPVVVYVATKPPRSFFTSFAKRFGKKIAYIPLGQLSRPLIDRVRRFHVLDGHGRRQNAGDFIF